MTGFQKQQKKKILSDPVAMFIGMYPNATEQQISMLDELRQQYHLQMKQQKEVQDQIRKFSRQIGEAKRNGNPADKLKASMRQISTQRRITADRLAGIEERIFALFQSEDDSASPGNPSLAGRVYPASPEAFDEVAITLADNERHEWNRYVEGNPAASIYHRVEWSSLIRTTFGHEGFYYTARSKTGTIVGILPLIRLKSRLFGDFMVSMPYFNYGGAIADHPSIESKLMQAANDHAASLGLSHIEYRDDIPREGLAVRAGKVNMILSLPDHHDELWRGFTSKLRAQIKRPQRENPQILCGSEEYLDDFYAAFARNMRDLGTPVYGKPFFRNILQAFPEESRILVVRINRRPVAAGFLLGHQDKLEIPWASTIRDVNHLSMNMLLYWEVLKFAIENRYRHFDFGRSSKESGTFRFKQQWGAKPEQSYWHYWLHGNSELPSLNPENPKFSIAINIWKRLPLTISKWLGPSIVRNLP